MNKFAPLALAATILTFSLFPIAVHAAEPLQPAHTAAQDTGTPAVAVSAGKLIYDAKGRLIAPVYRVADGGLVQVIVEDQLVSIPAQTLSESQGKVVTSLTKADLLKAGR